QDISILAGQIAGHSRSITEQMSGQKDDLSQKVTESLNQIESVRAALEQQASRLGSLSSEAEEKIVSLNGNIAESCTEISRATQTAITDLTSLEDKVSGRITTLRDESGKAKDAMETVALSLEQTAAAIEPVYLRAVEQAKDAESTLQNLRSGFDDTSESSL